jgi:hypothetical protein
MIGQRRPPTCANSHLYGSGFHGSPVVTIVRSWLVGRSLGEDEAAAERPPADDRPGAHDPAHVRREEDDVVLVPVGLVGDLPGDRDQEAALHVEDTFGLSGCA